MRYKTLITWILGAQILVFFIGSVITLSLVVNGLAKTLSEFGDSPIFRIVCVLCFLVIFPGVIMCIFLSGKIDTLTKIENQEDELENERDKYKQATDQFVKTFNIKSTNLL